VRPLVKVSELGRCCFSQGHFPSNIVIHIRDNIVIHLHSAQSFVYAQVSVGNEVECVKVWEMNSILRVTRNHRYIGEGGANGFREMRRLIRELR